MAINTAFDSLAVKPAAPAKGVADVRYTAMANNNMPRGTGYGSVGLGNYAMSGGGGSIQASGIGSALGAAADYKSRLAAYEAAQRRKEIELANAAEEERMRLAAELANAQTEKQWQRADMQAAKAKGEQSRRESTMSNVANAFTPQYGPTSMLTYQAGMRKQQADNALYGTGPKNSTFQQDTPTVGQQQAAQQQDIERSRQAQETQNQQWKTAQMEADWRAAAEKRKQENERLLYGYGGYGG